MREDVSLTCINCPLGCEVTVHFLENGEMQVSGNSCPRGEIYAKKEVTAPERIVTSSVRVSGGERPVVSVKTKETIPKGKIFDVMEEIRKVHVAAPVRIGDVMISDVCGTGVDIVATANDLTA